MVSKNNQWKRLQQHSEEVPHFSIRKLTVGVSSVLIGLSFMGISTTTVKADSSQVTAPATIKTNNDQPAANQSTSSQANDSEATAVKPTVNKASDNQAAKVATQAATKTTVKADNSQQTAKENNNPKATATNPQAAAKKATATKANSRKGKVVNPAAKATKTEKQSKVAKTTGDKKTKDVAKADTKAHRPAAKEAKASNNQKAEKQNTLNTTQKAVVNAKSLKANKTAAQEPVAQNVQTTLNWNGGTALESTTNWDSSRWDTFGYNGQFTIPLSALVAGNKITVSDFSATSSNNKYMFFQGNGGNHHINYTDPQTGKTVNDLGFMYFTNSGYRTGKIIFQVNKSIYDPQKNGNDAKKLITINFNIKDFVILNYFTDRHIFKGATAQKPYTETLHFAGKDYTFHVVPKIYNPKQNRNSEDGFVPYGQTDSGALQDYAWTSIIKDDQTFNDLQNSQGQHGNVNIPKTFKYYYRVTVKDPNDLANYGFHNPRVDFFTNTNAINSDGKMTDETKQMGGGSVPLAKAADNQSFDQLDSSLTSNDGAVYSKQADGSYLFAIHISADSVRRAAQVTAHLGDTNTVVFDKDENKANQATNHFYHDGVLKDLPICIIPEIRIDYNNYSTTDPSYTMHIIHKQGNGYTEVKSDSMSPVVDISNTKGQAGVIVHYLNGQTGEPMPGHETVSPSFGKAGSTQTIEIPQIKGYHLRNTQISNGKISFDNHSAQKVNAGDVVLTGSNNKVTLPGADKITNVYLVFDGDDRIDTINYLDDDNHESQIDQDKITGKVGETKSYSTTDKVKQHSHYHITKDELANDNQKKGVSGIQFDADGNKNYNVHLKHDTQTNNSNKSVTETINYQYENGEKAADTVTNSVTFTHHVTTDLVTGQSTVDYWDGSQTLPGVTLPTIDGYTPTINNVKVKSVADKTVSHDDPDTTITITYKADSQVIKYKVIDDTTHKTLQKPVELVTGHSDQAVPSDTNQKLQAIIQNYLNEGYEQVGSVKVPTNFDHVDNDSQTLTLHLKHGTLTVNQTKPGKPGQKINPQDPRKNPSTYPADSADLKRTVTRTIKETIGNGQPTTIATQQVVFTGQGTIDRVTGQWQQKVQWTHQSGKMTATPIHVNQGYHLVSIDRNGNGQQVKAVKVKPDTKNYTVNVVVAKDPTVQVVYVDQDNNNQPIPNTGSGVLTGVAGHAVNYDTSSTLDNLKKHGYVLVTNGFDPQGTTPKYDADNTKTHTYTVTLKHATTTVKPNEPKTPKDKLPDNPSKNYPSGVDEADLNKTITRLIRLHRPNGITHKTEQTVHLTRTAKVDEVTGTLVKYGDWSTGQWDSYQVPAIAGYTPHEKNGINMASLDDDQPTDPDFETTGHGVQVKKVAVDHNNQNTTIDIAYTPHRQTIDYQVVDNNTGTVISGPQPVQLVTGLSDHGVPTEAHQTLNDIIDGYKQQGYLLVDGNQVPNQFDHNDSDNQLITIHVKRGQTPVNHKDPKTPKDIIPGTNQHSPKGVDYQDLNKTITRTINITDPHSKQTATKTYTVTLHRDAVVDNVNGDIDYGNWTTGNWDAYTPASIDGYTCHITKEGSINAQSELDSIPAEKVTAQTPDEIFDVNYSADEQIAHPNFVDDTTNTALAKHDRATGHSDQGPITFAQAAQILKDYAAKGYQFAGLTNDATGTKLAGSTYQTAAQQLGNFDHNDQVDQSFTVHLTHGHTTVTPDTPKSTDDVIPGTNQHFPTGLSHDDLNRTVTRKIVINYPDGHQQVVTQTAHFTRTADVDDVTGKVTYGAWNQSAQTLDQFNAPSVPGYLATPRVIDALTVTPDSTSTTVEINYQAAPVPVSYYGGQAGSNQFGGNRSWNMHSTSYSTNYGRTTANQLPQTGNHNGAALVGLGAMGALLSLFGLKKKEDK